ncbi:MAG: V-type ATPase subunit [Longicatena sp.]
MSKASGVIVAKAKCMHGMQLDREDYKELLHKKSITEITSFLKNETTYAEALKDVRENNIHRGQLENLLRQDMFKKTMKLYRYAPSAEKKYYQLHLQEIEIEVLLFHIRTLISQEFEDAISELPLFLKAYLSFDLVRLGMVKTYDDLLNVIKNTMYYETLTTFRVSKGKEYTIDYTAIETTLQKCYYNHVFEVIDKVIKGKKKKAVKDFFISEVELANITKIYRFKKFFQAREDEIRESLIFIDGYLTNAFMEELIAEKSAEGVLKKLQQKRYHIVLDNNEDTYIEHSTEKILYDIAKKNFIYSQDAPLVFTSYLLIVNRELENITNIIEGIRYQVTSEDIEKMLIY